MRRSTPNAIVFRRTSSTAILFSLVLFLFFAAPPIHAQRALLESRASEIVDTIKKTQDKKIFVCDFLGPKGLTALGIKLADEFSDGIAAAGAPKITAMDRSQLLPLLHEVGIERERVFGELEGQIAAQRLGADDFIVGNFTFENSELVLHIGLHRVVTDRQLQGLEAAITLDLEKTALLNTPIHDTPQSNYPRGGFDGYSEPACIDCRNAEFSDAAIKKQAQGQVYLMLTIGPDGIAADVRVLKGLPDGLTEEAASTVRQWKFKPATDPNGNPATVRQIIMMQFHMY